MSILQPYFYIPIAAGIQHLNSQPAFAAGRGQGRDVGIISTSYGSSGKGKNSSKDGTYFLVYYTPSNGAGEELEPAVGRAKHFIRLVQPIDASTVERLVLADYCHMFPVSVSYGVEKLCGRKEVYTSTDYPVLLDMLHSPVAIVDRKVNNVRAGRVEDWRDYAPVVALSNRPGLRRALQHKKLVSVASGTRHDSE